MFLAAIKGNTNPVSTQYANLRPKGNLKLYFGLQNHQEVVKNRSSVERRLNYTVGSITTKQIQKSLSDYFNANQENLRKLLDGEVNETTSKQLDKVAREVGKRLQIIFPSKLNNKLEHISETQLLHIKNLPFKGEEDKYLAKLFTLGMEHLTGLRIFTYKRLYANDPLIHEIKPKPNTPNELSTNGSATRLTNHCDGSYDPNMPDYLSLYCLVGDQKAATTFVSAKTVVNALKKLGTPNIEMLFQPHFKFIRSILHKDGESNPSILPFFTREPKSRIGMRLTTNGVFPADTVQNRRVIQTLIDQVKYLLEQLDQTRVTLAPGDFILWNNRELAHGRDPFKAKYTPEALRFTIRAYYSAKKCARIREPKEINKLT